MVTSFPAFLAALSLAFQDPASTPAACPPKTTACAHDVCVPIGETCPSAAETAVDAGEVPTAAPVAVPEVYGPAVDDERAPLERRAAIEAACSESEAEFTARKNRRLLGFTLGSLAAYGVAAGFLVGLRERIPESELPDLPNCVNSKPCGRGCISYGETCHVGQVATMRPTTAGIIGGLVFAAIGLGLILGGLRSANNMQRRVRSNCTTSGCTFALRF